MSKKRKLQRHIEKVSRGSLVRRNDVHARSNVRLAIPFDMRCETCSEQICAGKKYYATKGTSTRENYLGVEVYVFEFKCPGCGSDIGFKTDPKCGAYVCDRNCRQVLEEKDEAVKIVEQADGESNKKEEELANIKSFIDSSRSVDIDKLKERLRRNFKK